MRIAVIGLVNGHYSSLYACVHSSNNCWWYRQNFSSLGLRVPKQFIGLILGDPRDSEEVLLFQASPLDYHLCPNSHLQMLTSISSTLS